MNHSVTSSGDRNDCKVNDSSRQALVVRLYVAHFHKPRSGSPHTSALVSPPTSAFFYQHVRHSRTSTYDFLVTLKLRPSATFSPKFNRTSWLLLKHHPPKILSTPSTANVFLSSGISALSAPSASTPSPALMARSAHSSESATYALSLSFSYT